MVNIFVTDSRAKYDQTSHRDRILYLDGFIGDCSFADTATLEEFNATLTGLDDEACRLMLQQLDEDTKTIISQGFKFKANRFISDRSDAVRIQSVLFNSHKHFLVKKYLFQLVMDRFFAAFYISASQLVIEMSEDYYLIQDLPYTIGSARFYRAFKNAYLRFLIKQVYYFFHRIFSSVADPKKTQIAIFLLDIHNEFDLLRNFMKIAKRENKVAITLVVIDSGNPPEKKVDASIYTGGNVSMINLFDKRVNLVTDYSSFYSVCEKLNPLYSIYRKARLCEWEDIQYGFVNNVISKLSPDVCLYLNIQEHGRVVANVSASYNIPSVCVEYAFAFDTYTMEKRIKFDARACISEITAQNWVKRKDPSTRREIIGFCKIDDWQEKLEIRERSTSEKPFHNDNRTILFASTWAPNPNSPLLIEKARIVKQLSDVCFRNGWNLLVKKHPSEFDTLVNDAFARIKHPNQKIVEHHEMSLFDCIYYADFVCTQNSSAFIETLYLNKPFSYITANGKNLWADLSYFGREKAVGTFGSVEEYEQYLLANAGDEAYKKLLEEFIKLQSKFLYKTDGKASERLLELAESFVKKK